MIMKNIIKEEKATLTINKFILYKQNINKQTKINYKNKQLTRYRLSSSK